jgi:hypothetical protein
METQENKPAQQKKRLEEVLATPPPKNIVVEHPIVKGLKYIPIGTVEGMLDRIFGIGSWSVKINNIQLIANSVVVCITLKIKSNDIEIEHDGGGAWPLQVNAGANPTDISQLKSNAVTLAVPIAKSIALKDAAGHLGEIFGRNLNREHYVHSMKTENKIEKEVVRVEINQNQNK